MFEKTLTDLIRGLRANKKDEERYIQSAIVECKKEARSQDLEIKAGAILKLTYLAMFGQDMAWASFYTVEVMASLKFINKRVGYMAASQGFRQDTDVLMLATNLIKKDIASSNASEVSVALGGLGDIVTPDLARDLSHDLLTMLSHSKATVRTKAVLVMYKIFLQYPEALRSSYPKLRERLQDSDQSVVSATINVIVELSRKNPKNYLPLAPELFELLTTSSNNWMLIKIIKLFATLTPLEPRLVKKLRPTLTELIQSTTAMSLLYECINTVISGDMLSSPNSESLAELCIMKLRTFFEADDQNLKYVGLIAFTKVIGTHPEFVSRHQDVVLPCIDDPDISIKMRALDLVSLMPSRKTLPEVVKRLVKQLLPTSDRQVPQAYRKDLVLRLLHMCSQDNYKHIENFDWYVAVLVDLARIADVDLGEELRGELQNVCVRVKSVREFAVPTLARLLIDRKIIKAASNPETNAAVLIAAAWAVGEYSEHLENIWQTLQDILAVPFASLTPAIQCSYLQAIPKLFCRWTSDAGTYNSETRSQFSLQVHKILRTVEPLTTSTEIEVQRRAVELVELFHVAGQCIEAATAGEDVGLPQFFQEILPNLYRSGGDINPVAPAAQGQLPVPHDLDLDAYIFDPTPEPSPEILAADDIDQCPNVPELDEETLEERRKERRERNKDDPYYLHTGSSENLHDTRDVTNGVSLDNVPIINLDDAPLKIIRKKRRPRNNENVEILADEVPDGIDPEISRSSSTRPLSRNENNVLRVDGSKLSAFDLDAKVEDEQEAFEAYEVISQAKAASRAKDKTASDPTKKKKKKKKVVEKEVEEGLPSVKVAPLSSSAILSTGPDIVEVIKKKKKKSKPVEL